MKIIKKIKIKTIKEDEKIDENFESAINSGIVK
jgi:hypothetical protein